MINNNCQDSRESLGAAWMIGNIMAAGSSDPSAEGAPPEHVESELEEIARTEREYVRGRVREELKREPTDAEMDEWLRQQTEGH